jgi:Ca-activated chloride channel family protein
LDLVVVILTYKGAKLMSTTLLQQFHFLRPEWLWAILPALLLAAYFWRQKSRASNWQGAINEQLLAHLVDGGSTKISRWPWLLLMLSWLVVCLALAGPSWSKLPQPVVQRQDALIIVLDLSLSMLAEDIKPSRLSRARHKVLDILQQRNEGISALIAYSGDAHIVSPLTDDHATIANLVPALQPNMMPVFGSDPVAAIKLARQLFNNAGINRGRVLLISDSITADDIDDIDDQLISRGFELSILGVGTVDGAPIPAEQGFLKDNNGNIIVPQLPRANLERLAAANSGRYIDISLSDNDINFLLPDDILPDENNSRLSDRTFDQWHDRGPWLAFLLLPFALLAFRRGWLLSLPLPLILPLMLVAALQPKTSHAFEWQDLWKTADQQASQRLQQGDSKAAASQFENPQWKASAQYQAEDYADAAENFARSDNPDDHYNRGNALARAGELDAAIAAYDKALEQQPAMEDAEFNKNLLEQLKQQQEQEQEENGEQKNDQDSEQQQNQDKQQSDQQQDDQQQGEQQGDQQPSEQPQDDQQQGDQQPPEQESEQNSNSEQSEQQENSKEASEQEAEGEEKSPQQIKAEEEQQAKDQQKQQAMEQWLRQIPDDPSGLLRRKFNYEYRLRQQQGESQREQPQW